MRRLVTSLLCLVILLTFCACGNNATNNTDLSTEPSQSTAVSTEAPTDGTTDPSTTPTEESTTLPNDDPTTAPTEEPTTAPTETPTTPTSCSHTYKGVTCTTPKTCTKCGATEGSALGHKWTDATCTAPKTCSKCKATEGKSTSHQYADGKCLTCNRRQLGVGVWQSTILESNLLREIFIDFTNATVIYNGYYPVDTMDPDLLAILKQNGMRIINYQGLEYINSVGDGASLNSEYGEDIIKVYFDIGTTNSATMERISPNQIKVTGVIGDAFFVREGWIFTHNCTGHSWTDATCTDPKTCFKCGATTGGATHNWVDANCTTPMTCSKCGATEGNAMGHSWSNATCTTPKTCSKCGATEGNAIGHSWSNATCTTPKTCPVCGTTEGTATGHSWSNATCTTPKTCSKCGVTEGTAAGHNWVDATCTAPKTCSKCGVTEGTAAGHNWVDATCTAPKTCSKCGVSEGSAIGHSWTDATCNTAKTCITCGAVKGEPLGHTYAEESKTNGYNAGSVITYCCSLCGHITQETIKNLTLSAYRSGTSSFNDWLLQVSYTANASGGYGKYQYKFEVYVSESSTSPALTGDFSENNRFSWSSRLYCNGHVLIITVQDEAGNKTALKIVVDTNDKMTTIEAS